MKFNLRFAKLPEMIMTNCMNSADSVNNSENKSILKKQLKCARRHQSIKSYLSRSKKEVLALI